MPKVIEKTIYKFDELSDRAKKRAREWFREGALDYGWWDSIYEDAATCGEILGIDIRQKPVKLLGGGTRYDPAIYFSGFYTQGRGARMKARYEYPKARVFNNYNGKCEAPEPGKKGKSPPALIRQHAPAEWTNRDGTKGKSESNAKLHEIADTLQDIQRRNFYGIGCDVKLGQGHYEHSHNTEITVWRTARGNGDEIDVTLETEEAVKDAMRSFMDWIFGQLQDEYEYRMSDEAVDADIEANEYTFDEYGHREG